MENIDKVHNLLRHIKNVQDNCLHLGLKLITLGEEEFGKLLIANGQIHDNSKWKGVEWDHLESSDPFLVKAIMQHSRTNPHHPEYWGSIQAMPEIYVAEMVCDWKARSSEFGTDLRNWIQECATKRYSFLMTDPVGLHIKKFLNLLLDKPF
jgi:hypothetical protein